jgi:hypothetical protein
MKRIFPLPPLPHCPPPAAPSPGPPYPDAAAAPGVAGGQLPGDLVTDRTGIYFFHVWGRRGKSPNNDAHPEPSMDVSDGLDLS